VTSKSLSPQQRPDRTSTLEPEAIRQVRDRRRDARREQGRREILDAAEQVFGQFGIHDGSLRRIGALSGFSTAAIYLFFENKQHLLTQTLARRGEEWAQIVVGASEGDRSPLDKLHDLIDQAVAFFADHPFFRQILGHLRGGATLTGLAGNDVRGQDQSYFVAIMSTLTSIIEDGQRQGEVRDGSPRSLAYLYSVLINEFLLLESEMPDDGLHVGQFHGLVDGALRRDQSSTRIR
jgi:AcrR family transcriptional regulator